MNLLHLKYVIEVEKTGSITKAAKNLFMGQPNLSKAIRELESEIGITIFKRTVKGTEATHQGAEFLSYAKTILSQIDELESLYKPHQENVVRLNISVPRASYISAAVTAFISQLDAGQGLDIRFKETEALTAITDVNSREADLGLIRFQDIYEDYFLHLLQDYQLEHEVLYQFEMMLMMSEEHPLAELEVVPYHMLSSYIELIHGDFKEPNLLMNQIKKTAQPQVSRRIYVYDRGSQMDLLQRVKNTFMWVSPVPEDVLKQNHLVLRKTAPEGFSSKDVIIYPKQQLLSGCAKKMLTFLREHENTSIQKSLEAIL